MIGTDAALRHAVRRVDAVDVEDTVTVAVATGIALAASHSSGGLGAAHHTACAVHGRVERLGVVVRLDALEDHRLVAHRTADEALLTGARGRAALADHPVCAAEVLLLPREVV